jgi:hypothetical protein
MHNKEMWVRGSTQSPSSQMYAVADAVGLARLITREDNLSAARFTAMKHLDRRIFLVQETATAEAACLQFSKILYPRIIEEFSNVVGMSGDIIPLSDRRFAGAEESLVVSLLGCVALHDLFALLRRTSRHGGNSGAFRIRRRSCGLRDLLLDRERREACGVLWPCAVQPKPRSMREVASFD